MLLLVYKISNLVLLLVLRLKICENLSLEYFHYYKYMLTAKTCENDT